MRSFVPILAGALLCAPLLSTVATAQTTAPPKDASGKVAPPGAAVAPAMTMTRQPGGQKPPTDASGKVADPGTPVAPSRVAPATGALPPPPSGSQSPK